MIDRSFPCRGRPRQGKDPMKVYGSKRSYYTGKLETYLRYRGIDYELLPTYGYEREVLAGAGTTQMPAVRLDDGRWMTDSSPILAWLESQQAAPSIYPADPFWRFVALLLEDYADEWLWRPAMHFRWSYLQDRRFVSHSLADEQAAHVKIPLFFKQRRIAIRQLNGFVKGDGVSAETWDHVEQGYFRPLDLMEQIFRDRPFLLGDAPTNADFGFMAPMYRHFAQDPTPAEIMRKRASGVYEWVARMWNARADGSSPALIPDVDAALAALLREACETHLEQLRQNARAHADGLGRYDQTIQGQRYAQVPSSRYRVWCLEELRREWQRLDGEVQTRLRAHLPEEHADVLWGEPPPKASEYDMERQAPFNRGINVYGTGVPA
jgi:glutathione S-transferase